ncbi:hypothetical protein B0H19DRAFT_1068941 [Mycena capillaripes]|nr:hypothetical protein B0H19DRAFT_1068941 [Mycena capillaripes]
MAEWIHTAKGRRGGREPDAGAATKNGESAPALRRMIFGQLEPGVESSLRLTLVNFCGAVQLDEIVRQRERTTGRSSAAERVMVNGASSLAPAHHERKNYAGNFGIGKSKCTALRKLVQQEVGAAIQDVEHSSHRFASDNGGVSTTPKEWERGAPRHVSASAKSKKRGSASAPAAADDEEDTDVVAAPTPAFAKNKSIERERVHFRNVPYDQVIMFDILTPSPQLSRSGPGRKKLASKILYLSAALSPASSCRITCARGAPNSKS